MKPKHLLFLLFILVISCNRNNEKPRPNTFAPKVVEAKGYVVPRDSMATPIVILVDESKLIKIPVGKPEVVATNTNIHIAINTNIHLAGKPRVCIPGTDTFLLPKTVPTIDSPFVAGMPEVVIVKDAHISDNNPQSFTSFGKLQGLKHANVVCMLEDKNGNIWLGTNGGVSRYDGKSFTHFTVKEGLSNNDVRSMLIDKNGNLWFGTIGGGVNRYDGKSFTHFAEKEGLGSNSVASMLEDKNGNIWFGTFGGGVTRYDGNRVEAVETALQRGEIIPERTLQGLNRKNGKLVKSFTHFTKKDGLSNNNVSSIAEDKRGNLWFGTDGGVSCYVCPDKGVNYSFTHFTEKEGLSNNFVLSMFEDKSGNLWFGTFGGGVSCYDGNRVEAVEAALQRGEIVPERELQGLKKENGKLVKSFTHFTEKEGLSNNDVRSILEDKNGNLWFGTNGGGVSYYADPDKGGNYSFTHFTEKEGLSNNSVFSMLEDKSGNVWFGTLGGGVSRYGGKSFTHFTTTEGLPNNDVKSILEDKSGNLWIGTLGSGISRYDGKSFANFTQKEGLSNNAVFSILEDKSGNLWFGTNYGVSRYDGNRVEAVEAAMKRGEIVPEGTLQGLKREKGKLVKTFTNFTVNEGLSNNLVFSMLEDRSGNIWFGTYNGEVFSYDGRDSSCGGLSGSVGKFTHFTAKEGLDNTNAVFSILQDKSGNLWFGTYGNGVFRYASPDKRGNSSFTQFTTKEGLSNDNVRSILEDKSGNIWFGTDGGVSLYACPDKGVNYSFTHFTEKEGLSNNVVLSMLEDKSGNLWFGTRFGLNSLSREKVVAINDKLKSNKLKESDIFFKNYTYEDGFLGIGCNGGNSGKNICQDNNGTIWIAANDRLTAFHPEGNVTEDTIPPNIQLTSISLFNENIAWINFSKVSNFGKVSGAKDTSIILGNGVSVSNFEFDGLTSWYSLPEHLSLAYNNNYLTFNFIGITQKHPKKVKYQYKLDGLDENWSALTNRTEAPYGNLPQGNYTFKVKAMNSEGYWSNEFNYTFTIRPPWWKTWWFRTFVAILIISGIVLYIKWRERSLIARQKVLEQTVEERTSEVIKEKKIVEKQKHLIEEKHKEIKEKHKEITDSINYAERIQRSFLATKQLLDDNLSPLRTLSGAEGWRGAEDEASYFVFFQPKDVVSGDFYWAGKLSNGNFALVTADSTGHGVPGAIMSILNISSLEKAVEEEKLTEPAEILNHTRIKIIERLKKDGSLEGGKDGMDVSLISFDFANFKLTYAAANNPVWIVRTNSPLRALSGVEGWRGVGGEVELIELAPDKMPVGKHDKDAVPFTQHVVNLQKGDVVYALTDGLPDQFGGPKGKKFMSKQLKGLIVSIAHLPMQEQKEILQTTLNNWKGNTEQVDDITVVGIRI